MGPNGGWVPLSTSAPTGYTPQQLQNAYGFSQVSFAGQKGDGAGQTIALVDAYDNPSFVNSTDPNFETSALHIFDQQFLLPDPPSFIKVNQNGQTTNLPGLDPNGPGAGDWEAEEALDVEWAHAMAPAANIVLVENDGTYGGFLAAEAEAGKLATVVSMSYGEFEYPEQVSQEDPIFQVPGVAFLASTGDHGAPGGYPAFSPHVVAVGGTSLYNLDSQGDYPGTGTDGEVGWSVGSDSYNLSIGGGGGISRYEPEPSYQTSFQSTGQRTIPDISADADPSTGVPIYDPYDFGTTWGVYGGTSLASPLMAGMVALADQGRVLGGGQTFSSDQLLAALYSLASSEPGDFHDILHGYNRFNAGPGYDLVTGLGTPNGSQLVPDLASFGMSSRPALTSITVTPGNPSVGVGLTQRLTAAGTYSDGTTRDVTNSVNWASATPSVATIDSAGLATTVAVGTSVITASLAGVSSPGVTLTSSPTLLAIVVTPGNSSVAAGLTEPFTATGIYFDDATHDITDSVTWASALPSVATIDSSGLATTVAVGTSVISASLAGVSSLGELLTVVPLSFVVNTTADDLNYTAHTTSLREAILAANAFPGHEITFDPNIFAAPQTITLALGPLELTDTTGTETITGPDGGVTVSGGGNSGVFVFDRGVNASISGVTIQGGKAAVYGGGLYDNAGTVTLTNCIVTGNSAGRGGGLFAYNGTVTLTNCTVSGNSASGNGGGLYALFGTATLTDCTVSDNSASGNGGGVYNNHGTATLTACIVSGNSAGNGGGLNNYDGTATLTDCTLSGNSASFGGGLLNDGTATLTDCTLSGNSAGNNGGGLYNYGGTATLTNTIVAGNSGDDIAGGYSGSHNLIGGNPLLAPLGDYGGPTQTMALLPGSPAIGTGTAIAGVTTDQRGFALDSPPDIGAFQTNPLVVNTTLDGTGSPSGDLSLRQAVNLANAIGAAGTGGTEAITFDKTVFAAAKTIVLDGTQLELKSGTETITGPAAGVTVSGNEASRVLQIDGGVTASISGLTITGGNSAGFGGGLLNDGTATLTDCTLSGNRAITGAGLDNDASARAYLYNCTLMDNRARDDGGGLNNAGTALLSGCTISGNTATYGGGVFSDHSVTIENGTTISGNWATHSGAGLSNDVMATITDSTISGNTAVEAGGGVYNRGTVSMTACTVSGNGAIAGAGLDNDHSASAYLYNCTLANNNAPFGAGLYNLSITRLEDCTISGNRAGTIGGGLYNASGTSDLTDTIVAGNTAHGGPNDISGVAASAVTGRFNLIGTGGSGGISNGSSGNIVLTSLTTLGLATLGQYGGPTETMALLPGSSAIGHGTPIGGVTTDQRGLIRGGIVHIGAFQSSLVVELDGPDS